MYLVLISLISYLLGSIPFSYLVARAYGKNLFEIGSRNIGTANVWRATGKKEALIVALIGDMGKGALAILISQKFGFLGYNLFFGQVLAAFFVVLGHNWPIFLKFKGGRGLASLAGVILVLNWQILFLVLAVIGFFIFSTELAMKKRVKLTELFSVFISQVLGRMIGIVAAAILVFLLYPQIFKILFPAVILSGIKHIKRTKTFLESQK